VGLPVFCAVADNLGGDARSPTTSLSSAEYIPGHHRYAFSPALAEILPYTCLFNSTFHWSPSCHLPSVGFLGSWVVGFSGPQAIPICHLNSSAPDASLQAWPGSCTARLEPCPLQPSSPTSTLTYTPRSLRWLPCGRCGPAAEPRTAPQGYYSHSAIPLALTYPPRFCPGFSVADAAQRLNQGLCDIPLTFPLLPPQRSNTFLSLVLASLWQMQPSG